MSLTRRSVLHAAGLVAAASVVPFGLASRALARPSPRAGRTRVLRVAHLTDTHIQPEKAAAAGVTACLHHVQSLADKPQLILTGGDHVMDTFATPFDRSKMLWELWTKTLKDDCSIPVKSCLGNHDIFGWHKSKSRTTGQEPQWGKKWALEMLGLARPYHSFDQAGWHFVCLDSVQPDGDGYVGRLDDEQAAWLDADLKAAAGKPTLVLSHIPILAVCSLSKTSEKEKASQAPWSLMLAEGMKLHKRFASAGNVRLCLSGHIHQIDRIEWAAPGAPADAPKVTYICDGAVSGSWWNGRKSECDEGYGVIDLFDDGTFEHHYETYGWQAKA